MARVNISTCPVCNNDRFIPFLTCTDFFVTGEQFEIKECTECGLRITAGFEDEENIGRYYQSEAYISHSNTAKGLVNRLYHGVREYMLQKKRRLVEKATAIRTGHVLDVGAGTAFFLNEMNRHGWQVTGTEKNPDARDFARSRFNLSLDEPEKIFSLPPDSFDVITMWHVLEHIHHPDKTMETLEKLLKPGGRMIIALPNPSSFDARHYKSFWAAWDVPRHLWHFRPEQITLFGRKYGFIMEKAHPMPFDAFYVSMLSEKYSGSNMAFLKGAILGSISWINCWKNPQKCSSVIYVFKKSPFK